MEGVYIRYELDSFLKENFKEYMLQFVNSPESNFEYKDVWGPSAFSEGLIKVCFLNNQSLFGMINKKIDSLKNEITISKEKDIFEFLSNKWDEFVIYRHWLDIT